MSKSPSLRRIQADIRELSIDPSDRYHAAPLENDMFEWHFTIRGAEGTDFEGGYYHGRILLPAEYPFKPPNIVFLTPSGRFETNVKVCLSFSAYHPELWQPAWGIRLILEALISFLPTKADGAIGALDWSSEERKRLAKASVDSVCPICGKPSEIMKEIERRVLAKKKSKKGGAKSRFQKEIEQLHALQLANEGGDGGNDDNKNEKKETEEDDAKVEANESQTNGDGQQDALSTTTKTIQKNEEGGSNDTTTVPKESVDGNNGKIADTDITITSTTARATTTAIATVETNTSKENPEDQIQKKGKDQSHPETSPELRDEDEDMDNHHDTNNNDDNNEEDEGEDEKKVNEDEHPKSLPPPPLLESPLLSDPILHAGIIIFSLMIYIMVRKVGTLADELSALEAQFRELKMSD